MHIKYFTLFVRGLSILQIWNETKLSIYFSIPIQYLFCPNMEKDSNTVKIHETSFLVFWNSSENFLSPSNAKYHII